MSAVPPKCEMVLLGAGHTHLHVLRLWRQAPIHEARLTCVSDFLASTYSGMLPGTLAGLYRPEQMQIDLVRLCQAAGVRLVRAEVTGLDLERRELVCQQGPPIGFDVLSIGIGSVPRQEGIPLDETALPIKPMQTFLPRLEERLSQLNAEVKDRPLRVAVAGGGAGGVEIALCLPPRLRQVLGARPYELSLIDAGGRLVSRMPRRTSELVRRELARRGTILHLGRAIRSVVHSELTFEDATTLPVDLVLWSTGPQAPAVLGKLGLPTDEKGFLLTRATLQSAGDERVFVVGDAGTIVDRPAPKAGVYSVRQGPILWGNLHRLHYERPLLEYRPQRKFLSLMAIGDGRAILSYSGVATAGRWCWRLKDWIDRGFVEQFRE